jgi:catechol 2,3-dioxygenase-like lactoylglutathione lyase family enzyme
MIKQFAGASVWSEDLNNLLPFYRDVLGLKVTQESPGYVVLGGDPSGATWIGLGTHSEVHGANTDAHGRRDNHRSRGREGADRTARYVSQLRQFRRRAAKADRHPPAKQFVTEWLED